MLFYTGFANYQQLKSLFIFLDANVGVCSRLNYWGSNNSFFQSPDFDKRGKKRTLLPIDELFLTLTRLRVNLPEKVLADHYNLSVPEVSRIFVTWIDFLYTRLIQLPIWASHQTVDRTMPECFKLGVSFNESGFRLHRNVYREAIVFQSTSRNLLNIRVITQQKG